MDIESNNKLLMIYDKIYLYAKEGYKKPIFPIKNEDIEELLKNPSSWYSKKLYAELLAYKDLHDEFIRYLTFVINLQYFLSKQKEDEQLRAQEKPTPAPQPAPQAKKLDEADEKEEKDSFKSWLDRLLSIVQAGMSVPELIAHHSQITANLSDQISAQLGPVIQIGDKVLVVPQGAVNPTPSLVQVLGHNPQLAKQVLSSPQAFVKAHTAFELGPLAVLNKYREILRANQQEDLSPSMILTLTKKIDKAMKEAYKNHVHLEQTLLENNDLLLQLLAPEFKSNNKPSLTEPPAFYAKPKPTPQGKKMDEEEEKKLNQRRSSQ